jgi:hypothetical protein
VKEIDWTKPIQFKKSKNKTHFVGFDVSGSPVIDTGRSKIRRLFWNGEDQYGESEFDVENAPEKVERWVIGMPESYVSVCWYPTEDAALTAIANAIYPEKWSRPVRIEVEMP